MLHVIIVTFSVLLLDFIVGCIVLSAIDKRGELYDWVGKAPLQIIGWIAVLLWPIVLALYVRKER